MNNKKIICYNTRSYPAVRNLTWSMKLLSERYDSQVRLNLLACLRKILAKVGGERCTHLCTHISRFSYILNPPYGCIVHTINNIVLNKNLLWVTTYESIIPYGDNLLESVLCGSEIDDNLISRMYTDFHYMGALKALLSPNCKKLIAMSCNAQEIFFNSLRALPSNEQEILRKKSCVILPPQPVISKGNFDRYIGIETYEFVFLGADAVRKGLLQLLTALLEVMKNCEKNIHLNVIGHIDKVSTSYGLVITQEESERCKQIIEENKNWITHYDYLQNAEVLNIFQKSHVGFLPTWADSFGFSVLEMQACGLPVVTTNVRAMTEINNQNIGWIAEVPCNSLKAGKYKSDWEKKQFAEILRKELIDIITDILSSNDEELKKKAMDSYFMIKNNRTIESHAAKLDALYSEIFD